MSKHIAGRFLLGIQAGAYVVDDNWKRLYPDYKCAELEDYLTEAWKGKP
jgi:hypothetical protein